MGTVSIGVSALAVANADRADTGGPLFAHRFGEGGPLLMFRPGIGGITRYGELVVAPPRDRYRLAVSDLLGFGHSLKP